MDKHDPQPNTTDAAAQNRVPTPDEIWKILHETAQLSKEHTRKLDRMQEEARQRIKEDEWRAKEAEQRAKEAEQRAAKEAEQRAKEDERRAKEAEQRAKEAEQRAAKEAERRAKEAEQRAKEAEQRVKEFNEILKKSEQQAAREMQEIRQQGKETDRRLRKAEGLFTTQWGKLMESLVEGDLVKLLQDRNINVPKTSCRIKGALNGEYAELDIVATGDAEVVVVEVKTTLRPEHVTDFAGKLDKLVRYEKDWYEKKLYGAVAYLKTDESVQVHAERQGLLVIRATGSSASIVNDKDNFRLREYRSGKFIATQQQR